MTLQLVLSDTRASVNLHVKFRHLLYARLTDAAVIVQNQMLLLHSHDSTVTEELLFQFFL